GVQGELALTLRSEGQGWQVQAGQVRAQSARLQWGEVRLQDVLARFSVEGRLTATQIDLRVQPGAELSARQLTHPLLQMDRVRIQPGALVLSGTPQDLRMQAPLDVQVGQLRAPHVHAQGWRWQGPVTLQWTQNPSARNLSTQNLSWHAKGVVRADSGLSLSLDARHTPDGAEIALTLQDLFLRAGNPLARTLVAWPALLELNNGRLNARATLKLGGIAPVMDAQLDIKGAAGIYDRAAFEGLTAQAQVQWDARTLRLNLPALDLVRLDVGVPIGPMRLQADYQATPQTLASGTLSWTQARAGLLGGQVMLAPGQRRLDAQDEPLTLQLTGLELEQLFRLYPAEDLAGQGTVDGSLPLRIGPQGVSVAAGELQAREPGGRLLLRSPRIQALGRSNPGMQLVVQSLEDFHYAVLRSGVSYDENGKLLLTLRLEGRNPSVEGGRPIHFNITLEEDLPALLASLQLTDTVSETIKKRVQERMRQRPPSPP
ncbi:MAG: YdbH domain-containing protein, partial [Gammaproteobacteria bacterium]|nr:YdbH domain-containing protein [Gammaproteobacteria bacterium]